MQFDERAFLGDPAAKTRRGRVPGSAAACAGRAFGARPFPVAAAKILTLTAGDMDVDKVVRAFEDDAPLATRVLRLVNSPAFGLRTKCKSIRQAVTMLGRTGVREAVIGGAMLRMFPGSAAPAWQIVHDHASLVGALARHLAPEWRLPTDEMFLGAFLHDIGKWVLLDEEPDYAEIVEQHLGAEATLDEEHGRYGFDHAELAEHLTRAWELPAPIPRLIGLHHDPAEAYTGDAGLATRVALLRLADELAHAIAANETPDFDAMAAREPLTYLGLGADALRERFAFLGQACTSGDEAEAQPPTPSAPPMLAAREPKPDDACSQCGAPAFAGSCPRCSAHLCGACAPGEGRLCAACEAEFTRAVARAHIPTVPIAFGVLLVGLVAVAAGIAVGGDAWFLALVGFALSAAGVVSLVRRFAVRVRFVDG